MGSAFARYSGPLTQGQRLSARDVIGANLGLAAIGDIFYVDGTNGSDTAYKKNDPNQPLATVSAALDAATADQNDCIVINPNTSGTGRVSESSAIAWNKARTHLIGAAAPTVQDARAGINFATGGSLTVSVNGCMFENLTFFSSADIDETVSITGSYNHFGRVDFKGTSNATSADSTPWRALNINGGQENTFDECTLGGDTYTRGVANATLELEGSASRNVFNDCRFVMHADTANSPVHVLLTGASAIDRWVEFKNCSFYAFWENDTDKIAAVFDASAQTATGHILLTGNALAVGADDWEASASGNIYMQPATATTNAIGLAVNPT